MMLARLRGAAIGGLAVLLLSGAGVAFAGNAPTTPPVTLQTQVQPATGASTASGQQVDLQQGDQTAPDAAGTAAEVAGVEAPETAAEAASGAAEAAGTETDGPGGHTDAAGGNVDHQFQGEQ
ncbi:MAG: hypothetical protein M0Z49_04885 [Chloroflexi bacterium]|nr:hypothetical protein [Chloroflexota bacterium]